MIEKEKILKIDFFKDFTDNEIEILSKICDEENYKKNSVIFEENEKSDRFYFIIKGQVKISHEIEKSGEEELIVLHRDECFGEMAWIDGHPRSATAVAEENSALLTIKTDCIDSLMYRNSKISTKILNHFCKVLSARLRDANKQISEITGLFISFRTIKK